MAETGGLRGRELERIALIVVPAAQVDAVAFFAALRHPHDVDEKLAALLEFRRQHFDMAEMSDVVDRFRLPWLRSSCVAVANSILPKRSREGQHQIIGRHRCDLCLRQAGRFGESHSDRDTSRTPHSGFSARRLASNAALLGDVCAPSRLNGPYTNKRPCFAQQSASACKQILVTHARARCAAR